MSLVNDALPPDALPDERHLPNRDARHALGYPQRLNVCQALLDDNLCAGLAAKPVIRYGGRIWTYGLLAERANRLANALTANGVKPGHRVLIHLPNIPEFIESWLATLRVGAVVVATMPLYKRRELQHIVDEIEPFCLVTTSELRSVFDECSPLPDLRVIVGKDSLGEVAYEHFLAAGRPTCQPARTDADDVAIIAYTSGTTGQPKGTIHTHSDLVAIADTYAREVLAPTPGDRFMGHPSLAFTYGLGGLLVFPMRFGSSVILDASRFDATRWLASIRHEQPTLVFSTPTACRMFMEEAACREDSTWQSVHTVVSAGQKLPRDTFLRWREITGVQILDGCGSTEMLHIWISQRPSEAMAGCTGRPIRLYEARLLDEDGSEIHQLETEGIIALRGPTGCRYWRRAELQTQSVWDGWTLPGDRFRRDTEGRYWHVSRTDDIIISGGYKIAPAEVEEVLLQCPAVLEAAVVGVPDQARGQFIRAYTVLKNPHSTHAQSLPQIRNFLKREIADFKCPHEVVVVESLPRTCTGKLDRLALTSHSEVFQS